MDTRRPSGAYGRPPGREPAITGTVPDVKTWALDSAVPLPVDWKKPVVQRVFGMGAAESAIQETPAARMVGGIAIHRPELLSATSRQRIIIWLSTGLLKNPAAPAASARWRRLSVGKAVM